MLSACDAVQLQLANRRADLIARLAPTAGTAPSSTTASSPPSPGSPRQCAHRGHHQWGQFQDLAEALSRITDHGYDTLAAIFGSPELTGLTPGQIDQIEWYVNTRSITNGVPAPSTGYHAFPIGRKAGGSWFLSDTDAGLVGAFRIELTPVY